MQRTEEEEQGPTPSLRKTSRKSERANTLPCITRSRAAAHLPATALRGKAGTLRKLQALMEKLCCAITHVTMGLPRDKSTITQRYRCSVHATHLPTQGSFFVHLSLWCF